MLYGSCSVKIHPPCIVLTLHRTFPSMVKWDEGILWGYWCWRLCPHSSLCFLHAVDTPGAADILLRIDVTNHCLPESVIRAMSIAAVCYSEITDLRMTELRILQKEANVAKLIDSIRACVFSLCPLIQAAWLWQIYNSLCTDLHREFTLTSMVDTNLQTNSQIQCQASLFSTWP